MNIIDAHSHLKKNPDREYLEKLVASGIPDEVWLMVLRETSSAETLKTTLKISEQYGDFFKVFGFLDYQQPPEHIQELFELGCVGLKSILPEKPYDDPAYFEHYRIAEKLGLPITFHTGVIGSSPYTPTDVNRGPRNMQPSMLMTICNTFPELTVINAHPGFPWTEDVIGCLRYTKNYYVDISGGHSLPYLKSWIWDFLEGQSIQGTPFTDKILLGVDGFTGDKEGYEYADEIITFWKLFFKHVGRGSLWSDAGKKIMGGNAKRLLDNCMLKQQKHK
jgi:predicted TIM-barrel fold metal-dependent hydrolase